MTANPQSTPQQPTSKWPSTRTGTKLRLAWYWSVVLGLGLFVYLCGLVVSLAAGPLLSELGHSTSPSCSVANFGTPSGSATVTK